MVPNFNVMMKPASGMCNLRCKYCFYTDEMENRETPNLGLMSEETLKNVLTKVLAETTSICTIAFQGGEPTIAGLDFFKKAVAYAKELNVNHCKVDFALQTNGTLLTQEWCQFFAENRFLVGVSLDGVKDTHDRNRLDAEDKGTYQRVTRALQMLESAGCDFNILTVVTKDTARNFRKIYGFYERNGWEYQQYIPCLDPLGEERGQYPWSLTPDKMGEYLKSAFDCWYQDLVAGKKKYHRYFDNLLLMLDGQMPEACGMAGFCGMQYVVEADGSTFPCDFYMMDEYCIGNFNTDSIEEMNQKRREIGFIQASLTPDPECLSCPYKDLCRGGCRRDRDYFEKGIGKNYFCPAYKEFFAYALPRLQHAYRILASGRR